MIIATIGSIKLKLETLKDAEALLNIASRATLIESSYDVNYHDYQYIAEGEKRLAIEITEGDTLVSLEEHQRRRAERNEKEAAKLVSVGKASA